MLTDLNRKGQWPEPGWQMVKRHSAGGAAECRGGVSRGGDSVSACQAFVGMGHCSRAKRCDQGWHVGPLWSAALAGSEVEKGGQLAKVTKHRQ